MDYMEMNLYNWSDLNIVPKALSIWYYMLHGAKIGAFWSVCEFQYPLLLAIHWCRILCTFHTEHIAEIKIRWNQWTSQIECEITVNEGCEERERSGRAVMNLLQARKWQWNAYVIHWCDESAIIWSSETIRQSYHMGEFYSKSSFDDYYV